MTNVDFQRFFAEIRYVTLAEKPANPVPYPTCSRGIGHIKKAVGSGRHARPLERAEYVWSDELMPNGKDMANTWQGEFPHHNTLDDGYEHTAPVGSFPGNGYSLYDIAGNVWHWTADWCQEGA